MLAISSFRLLALLPVSFLLYLIGLVIYRLYFHPLAKYPGPLLAKITDLYQTYHALRGDRHLEFWRCHEKYGDIVRFGPNSLSFNTNTALKDIYGFKSNVRKAKFYQAFWATKDSASTHSSIDRSIHARKRRVLSHAFSDAAIKSMENHILAHIRQFCQTLSGTTTVAPNADAKGYSHPIDISDQANYLTFDIMGDLCFGKAFGMLERPDNRFAIDLIGSAAHRHLICGTYLPIHEYHLDKLFFRKIAAGRARYMQYSKSQALERTKMGLDVDRKDFFYHLLKAKDPETGAGFSTPELWGESNLLIIAGSDTTSTALAATIFYLVHNPATLTKLIDEVRTAFTHVEEITISPALNSLTYLRACIDEAMRLSPSVGGLLPREVLPGGITIDSHPIPSGTIVGVPHYSIHHNASYYPSPFTFNPSRWLGTSSPDSVALAQSAFCPFSVGPRGCIGKGMAYHELMITVARVVFLFELRLAPGEGEVGREEGRSRRGEFQLKDSFTSIKEGGPMVQFRARS
ncbi:Cytochrome P450 monooxygenase AKT7 [Fulvia fulva]|uniref:Cytochrome P450 monooxygenase AKT7 n=1 Tax=Passalora fulva TaxID=5499 RepID=A0A9Q8PLQ9_PASFU|nr:Cytochrome P450 monooxygenase AKT7 [Fulvia fulva]KAK4609215.1 Cytochrome P450 monooxygenase AKT7 [Fulvia fulva]KAK4609731.1 Cytochrome P450 monooxygenase AKT7 [Fulvia fulva]UJO24855.1 Cytochrome P450 monooxygenase AKT7 [Fulvia fulva]WPV22904.1 Cytochrome P450 monooxygenase AKT7 [Fulvia fulva]WPV37702.1 Cytochrome P450 monooxygenase AKT7 [Fulvia fulva]